MLVVKFMMRLMISNSHALMIMMVIIMRYGYNDDDDDDYMVMVNLGLQCMRNWYDSKDKDDNSDGYDNQL